MPEIRINGQIIAFPDAAQSPDWAPAIIQFAQAVQDGLAIAIGTYDVAPQSFNISPYNPGTSINIPNLSFPVANVRAVFIRYSVFRTTDTNTAYEAGTMIAMYNPNNPVNSKWAMTRGDKTGGDGQIDFYMTDNGQMQITTSAVSGSNHSGKLVFDARSLEQS